MIEAAGVGAATIEALWWPVLATFTVVFLAVATALALALRERTGPPPSEHRLGQAVAGALGVTTVILFAYLAADLFVARLVSGAPAGGEEALTVRVTGHQWWWEITYEDSVPARRLTTANELRIPVGVPVRLSLTSGDVIHSLWIPELHGKKDLLPRRTNEHWLLAEEPGVYEGRCAEFCGHQHAHMGFRVVAEPRGAFDAWYEAQLLPAEPPADSVAARGLEVLTTGPCVLCHTIRGTLAGGRTGPDLTHLASRATLAAGTLPNTRGHLAGWIVDPQRIKPGAHMPPNGLTPSDLQALLTYLDGLR